jgi:hypothetical protein
MAIPALHLRGNQTPFAAEQYVDEAVERQQLSQPENPHNP